MNTTVSTRQSLLDIAIQHAGTAQTALELALLNGISLTDDLEVGSELVMTDVVNEQVVQTFVVSKLIPATAITSRQILEIIDQQEGINFWAIEYDFIVQ